MKRKEVAEVSVQPADRSKIMRSFVLASQSPRRIELLKRFIKDIIILPDSSPEEILNNETPAETVMRLSLNKAINVAATDACPNDAFIIAADTVVALDNKILGKPKDETEAYKMLKMLSGRRHCVYTGMALLDKKSGKRISEYESTQVEFCEIPDETVKRYITTGEPFDKAGAYGIQDFGALLVKKIDGDYFNVVGLPLCKLGSIAKEEFGIDLMSIGKED